MENTQQARRYNKGKLRYELLPVIPLRELVRVYTLGAHKYSLYKDKEGNIIKGSDVPYEKLSELQLELVDDGADNWRKGLPFTETIGSIQRHLEAIRSGEDIDSDLGTLHAANAAWGLFAIMEYMIKHPEMDNRNK